MRLVEVGPDRAAEVEQITRRIWTGQVSENSTVFRETPETVAAQIAKGGAVLVFDSDQLIGSGRFVMVPGPMGDDRSWMEVKRIGLLKSYRGLNGGEVICRRLEMMGQGLGAVGAQLAVREDQPRLVRVYTALGYQLADDVDLTTHNPLVPPPIGMRKWFS